MKKPMMMKPKVPAEAKPKMKEAPAAPKKMEKKEPATPKVPKETGPSASMDSMGDDMRRMKVEDAMHTMMRAQEHMKDKGLVREVKAMAKDKMKCLGAVCGKG